MEIVLVYSPDVNMPLTVPCGVLYLDGSALLLLFLFVGANGVDALCPSPPAPLRLPKAGIVTDLLSLVAAKTLLLVYSIPDPELPLPP